MMVLPARVIAVRLRRLTAAVLCLLSCATGAGSESPPATIGLDGSALLRLRGHLPAVSLRLLRQKAAKWLEATPVAVTDKKVPSPSGNPHDYVSLGRYWWPNPDTPTGLPYVRRDGQPNPENDDYDRPRFERMVETVEDLSLAWYFTGEAAFAAGAARQLRVWFLEEATRMTPHLEHAQLIKGINRGRGIGLIDVRGLTSVVDGEALLRGSPSWTDADHQALVSWFREYFHWLTMSRNGREEAAELNNHGTWYDVQAVTIALFLGERESARRICEAARTRRLARQIEPDGRQPGELGRTLSFFYVCFNLDGLFRLARLGEQVGVDLWHHRSPDGRSLRAALDWLLPYATGQTPWTFPQISPPGYRPAVSLLRRAAVAYHEPAYEEAIRLVPGAADELPWTDLLFPNPHNDRTRP